MKLSLKSKGFSLIEVLISLVILSIALLGLAGLMVTATKNNSFGGHMTEATTFAQDKLEELRAVRWENIIPNKMGIDQRTGSTGTSYIRNWNAVQNGNLKTITITINWNDITDHSVSFLSVVSQ